MSLTLKGWLPALHCTGRPQVQGDWWGLEIFVNSIIGKSASVNTKSGHCNTTGPREF